MTASKRQSISVIVVCSFFVLLLITILVLLQQPIPMDSIVNAWITAMTDTRFVALAMVIGFLSNTYMMSIYSMVVVLLLWFRSKRDTTFFAASMILTQAIVLILKETIDRPRPENALMVTSSASFPSGHTTTAVVFFGLLLFFVWKHGEKKSVQWSLTGVFLLLFTVIASSRLYLNVHWVSDIIAGIALGIALVGGMVLFLVDQKHVRH